MQNLGNMERMDVSTMQRVTIHELGTGPTSDSNEPRVVDITDQRNSPQGSQKESPTTRAMNGFSVEDLTGNIVDGTTPHDSGYVRHASAETRGGLGVPQDSAACFPDHTVRSGDQSDTQRNNYNPASPRDPGVEHVFAPVSSGETARRAHEREEAEALARSAHERHAQEEEARRAAEHEDQKTRERDAQPNQEQSRGDDPKRREDERRDVLCDLERLKLQGVTLSRQWCMDDDVDDMTMELRRHSLALDEKQNVAHMRDGLRMAITGIEFANNKFGLLDLEGWSNEATKELNKHDANLARIYRKYWRRGTSRRPEVEISMSLLSSMGLHHMKRVMAKQVMSGMTYRGSGGRDTSERPVSGRWGRNEGSTSRRPSNRGEKRGELDDDSSSEDEDVPTTASRST